MNDISIVLKVFFSDPFWIGVFEYQRANEFVVYKHTFGNEPSDHEIYEFILHHFYTIPWSPMIDFMEKKARPNPKRMQRLVHRQLDSALTIGTKAQQALKLQQEQRKLDITHNKYEKKREQKKMQFERKQEKRKQKHKGH